MQAVAYGKVMATLTIRSLDENLYSEMKIRAKANGRSLEAEARQVLRDHYGNPPRRAFDDVIADLRARYEKAAAEGRLLPDSTPLIRAMRDEE